MFHFPNYKNFLEFELKKFAKEFHIILQNQKQDQGLLFEKIVYRMQLQIYKGNRQQGRFTAVKFVTILK